jgi:hypothetical protein
MRTSIVDIRELSIRISLIDENLRDKLVEINHLVDVTKKNFTELKSVVGELEEMSIKTPQRPHGFSLEPIGKGQEEGSTPSISFPPPPPPPSGESFQPAPASRVVEPVLPAPPAVPEQSPNIPMREESAETAQVRKTLETSLDQLSVAAENLQQKVRQRAIKDYTPEFDAQWTAEMRRLADLAEKIRETLMKRETDPILRSEMFESKERQWSILEDVVKTMQTRSVAPRTDPSGMLSTPDLPELNRSIERLSQAIPERFAAGTNEIIRNPVRSYGGVMEAEIDIVEQKMREIERFAEERAGHQLAPPPAPEIVPPQAMTPKSAEEQTRPLEQTPVAGPLSLVLNLIYQGSEESTKEVLRLVKENSVTMESIASMIKQALESPETTQDQRKIFEQFMESMGRR